MGKKQITNATYLRLVRLSTKRETKGASVKQTNADNNNNHNNYYGKQKKKTNSGSNFEISPFGMVKVSLSPAASRRVS